MHVVFVEPSFPANQREFVRALVQIGARVTAIGERSVESLGDELRSWLAGYERIGSVVDCGELYTAVRRIQQREWVDRLEATVEAHVLPTAEVREGCTIPGTSVRTAHLCRDKPAMKDALRAAGVRCARSTGASSAEDVRAFVDEVGFPVILKPRDSAGAAGTYRADDGASLEQALRASGVEHGAAAAVEEFVEGHEAFYDTLCIGGRVVHEFISHYYPGVLHAMRTRWISPYMVCTNRVDAPAYEEVRGLARRVIEVLGIGTSATHMEWFFGPKGLMFSEIACRPPGVRVWDLYNVGNEMDLYAEWARAIVLGRTECRPSRRFATGMIALRPDRDGTIVGYDGLEEAQHALGQWVIDAHFPEPGTSTQPPDAGYMANAWVRMRHPDYDELRRMFESLGETVQVRAR